MKIGHASPHRRDEPRRPMQRRWGAARVQPLRERSEPRGGYSRGGVCFARNSFMRSRADISAAPVFHSGMNSQFGSSFESSSEIGYGCASSLPANTRHGVRTAETNARSTQ